jgi:hypothetical protein
MPKIKNIVLNFGKRESYEIWHNSKDKFYLKTSLPIRVRELFPEVVVTYCDELKELESCLNWLERAYQEAIQQKRRVIIFNLSVGRDTIHKLDLWSFGNMPGLSLQGVGFSLKYWVADERKIDVENKKPKYELLEENEKGEFVHKNEGYCDNSYNTIIDFTPERYEKLKQIEKLTEQLTLTVVNFFGKDPKALENSLDNKQLMLGNGEQ